MDVTEFGRVVESARGAKGLTRAVLVRKIGNVSADYLAAIENGTTNPRLSTVLALCDALNIEVTNNVLV